MRLWRAIELRPGDSSRSGEGAFTVVELLVGIAILAVLIVFLAQMFSIAGRFWTMEESSKVRLQNMRAANGQISSDLQAALLPVNRPETNSLQFVVNPDGVSAAYRNPDAIFWQAPVATDQTLGDIAEIGYFVQWDESTATPKARLCRFFVNPVTVANGVTNANANYLIYAAPSAWISDAAIQAVAPADKTNAYQGLFAENIIGLWVRCLDSSGNLIVQDAGGAAFSARSFDSRRYTSPVLDTNGARISVASGGCSLPASVELSMMQLDAPSAARLGAAQEQAIKNWCSQATNAADFLNLSKMDPALAGFRSGLRASQVKIYLQTSK